MQWIYNSPLFRLSLTFSSNLDKKKEKVNVAAKEAWELRPEPAFWSIYIHHESVGNYKFRAAPLAGQFIMVSYGDEQLLRLNDLLQKKSKLKGSIAKFIAICESISILTTQMIKCISNSTTNEWILTFSALFLLPLSYQKVTPHEKFACDSSTNLSYGWWRFL